MVSLPFDDRPSGIPDDRPHYPPRTLDDLAFSLDLTAQPKPGDVDALGQVFGRTPQPASPVPDPLAGMPVAQPTPSPSGLWDRPVLSDVRSLGRELQKSGMRTLDNLGWVFEDREPVNEFIESRFGEHIAAQGKAWPLAVPTRQIDPPPAKWYQEPSEGVGGFVGELPGEILLGVGARDREEDHYQSVLGKIEAVSYLFDVANVKGALFLPLIGRATRSGAKTGRTLMTGPRTKTLYNVHMDEARDQAIQAFADAQAMRQSTLDGYTGIRSTFEDAVSELGPAAQGKAAVARSRMEFADQSLDSFKRTFANQPGYDYHVRRIEAARFAATQPPHAYQESVEGLNFMTNLRPIEDVVAEINTLPRWLGTDLELENLPIPGQGSVGQRVRQAGQRVTRGAIRMVNPSAVEDTDIGMALTAHKRQLIHVENIIEAAAANLHRYGSRYSDSMPFAIDADGYVIANPSRKLWTPWRHEGERMGLWQDVFAMPDNPQWADKLDNVQRDFIDDFHKLIAESELLRRYNGLESIDRNFIDSDGQFYVPRQVREVRGVQITRPTRNELTRVYETAQDGFDAGIRYSDDPIETAKLYMRSSLHDVANHQLGEHIAGMGWTGKEIMLANHPNLMLDLDIARKRLTKARRDRSRAQMDPAITAELSKSLGRLLDDYNQNFIDVSKSMRAQVSSSASAQRGRVTELLDDMERLQDEAFSVERSSILNDWRAFRGKARGYYMEQRQKVILKSRNQRELLAGLRDIDDEFEAELRTVLDVVIPKRASAIRELKDVVTRTEELVTWGLREVTQNVRRVETGARRTARAAQTSQQRAQEVLTPQVEMRAYGSVPQAQGGGLQYDLILDPVLKRDWDALQASLETTEAQSELLAALTSEMLNDFRQGFRRDAGGMFSRLRSGLTTIQRSEGATTRGAGDRIRSVYRRAQDSYIRNYGIRGEQVSQALRNLNSAQATMMRGANEAINDALNSTKLVRPRRRDVRNIIEGNITEQAQGLRRMITENVGLGARISSVRKIREDFDQYLSKNKERIAELELDVQDAELAYDVLKGEYDAKYANTVGEALTDESRQLWLDRPETRFADLPETISVSTWEHTFFPRADAMKLRQVMGTFQGGREYKGSADMILKAVNLAKLGAATIDVGWVAIQGAFLIARHPSKFGEAVDASLTALLHPRVLADEVVRHRDTYQEMADYGISFGRQEFMETFGPGGTFKSLRYVEELPGGQDAAAAMKMAVNETFGRFQGGYNTFLSVARRLIWQSHRERFLENGDGLDELAALVRNMTGGLDSRAIGVGPNQRLVETAGLFFSPRLFRSTAALASDAVAAFRGPTTRQRESLKAISAYLGGVHALWMAGAIAQGYDANQIKDGLNPLSGRRYLGYKVGDDWWGVGGQMRAITQLMVGLMDAMAGGTETDWTTLRDNPLVRYMMSRGGVGLNFAMTAGEGLTNLNMHPYEDISGQPAVDRLEDMGKKLGTSMMPFAVQGLLDEQQAISTPVEAGGLRVTPFSGADYVNNAEREALERLIEEGEIDRADVVERVGVPSWFVGMLPPGQRAEAQAWGPEAIRANRNWPANVKAKVRRQPEVVAAQEKRLEKYRDSDSRFEQWYLDFAAENALHTRHIDEAWAEFGFVQPEAFRKRLKVINELHYSHLYGGPDPENPGKYQRGLKGRYKDVYESFDTMDESEDPFNIALADYLESINNPRYFNDATGLYDYAARDEAEADFVRDYGPDTLRKIRTYLRENQHPVVRQLSEDMDRMRSYWEIEDRLFADYQDYFQSADLKHVYQTYQDVKKTSTTSVNAALMTEGLDEAERDLFVQFTGLLENEQRRYRFEHPDVERLLYKWGYVGSFVESYVGKSGERVYRSLEPNGDNPWLERILLRGGRYRGQTVTGVQDLAGQTLQETSVFSSTESYRAAVAPLYEEANRRRAQQGLPSIRNPWLSE